MNRILLACLAAATLGMSASAQAAEITPVVQVQTPCREAGHSGVQGCVVVHKFVSGQAAPVDANMNVAVGKALQGKAQKYSVIYVYHANPRGHNLSISVHKGNETMISDLAIGQPVSFWTTTRDGGRTWGQLTTTDMGSVISY